MNVMFNEKTGHLVPAYRFKCSECGFEVICMDSDKKKLMKLACPRCDRLCWEEENNVAV